MKAYMQTIVFTMILAVVVEMIFPEGDYKKYLKLIMGCVIVYTLISPIASLLHLPVETYDVKRREYENRLMGSGEYKEEIQRQQEVLKKEMKENMQKQIEKKFELRVDYLALDWKEEDTGMVLNSITMTVGPKNLGDKQKRVAIKRGEKGETIFGEEENLKNKIKTCLSNFYNVQDRNIHITVQKNL